MTLYQVNASRLLGWIAELRQIGTNDALGPGIHRPSLSPADLEGRAWFRAKIKEHNLVEHIGMSIIVIACDSRCRFTFAQFCCSAIRSSRHAASRPPLTCIHLQTQLAISTLDFQAGPAGQSPRHHLLLCARDRTSTR